MSVRRVILSVCGILSGVGVMVIFLAVIGVKCRMPTVAVFQPAENIIGKDEGITLPADITGTPLVLEEVVSYDGVYMEDSSGSEVTNVAAALLRNNSTQWIRSARVTLSVGNEQLYFFVQELPPGQSALVLEQGRRLYSTRSFTTVFGDCDYVTDLINDDITARISGDELILLNRTKTDVENILVYYRTVYADGLFYMGGRVLVFTVPKLIAGESAYLHPPYFAGEHSRVLRIEYKRSSIK